MYCTDLDISSSQLNQEQMEMAAQQRERGKLDRENRKLREEFQTLQEQMSERTIPRAQMEVYKKEIEDKVGLMHVVCIFHACTCIIMQARRELTRKLEEVNAHMDQQVCRGGGGEKVDQQVYCCMYIYAWNT